ncbi:MAG TPA: queuosine salvage family protein [Patescibacteria group bacterium]|nr:queuosine salvage family protein [Patescibacteria group bacterium]
MIENPVRTTSRWVVARARDVSIDHSAVSRVARFLRRKNIRIPVWSQSFHLTQASDTIKLRYIFVLDSLNFCFWSRGQKWSVPGPRNRLSGYMALAWQLKNFFKDNPNVDFRQLQTLSYRAFRSILGGSGELHFLRERHRILTRVSKYLVRHFDGDPSRLLRAGKRRAEKLVPLLAAIPSFDDTTKLAGRKVHFYKRAQILVGDIWGAFGGRGIGRIDNIGYLTAFADYKIPQILRDLGILRYSPKLAATVGRRDMIAQGSPWETEIRASTIVGVEELKDALHREGASLPSLQLDWYLWITSKSRKKMLPHNLTKTVYY